MQWLKQRLWTGFGFGGWWVKVATCPNYGDYFSWKVKRRKYVNAVTWEWWRIEIICHDN